MLSYKTKETKKIGIPSSRFTRDIMKNRIALIKTSPIDRRNPETINIGLEIIKSICIDKGFKVDIFSFRDKIDYTKYDIIGFNVYYLMNQMNVIPFLTNNSIPVLKRERNSEYPLLIGGGDGFINQKLLSNILDYIVFGDGEEAMETFLEGRIPTKEVLHLWNKKVIDSKPYIHKKRGIIELTRGCTYRCNFCSYAWCNGKYREKDIRLVKKQILYLRSKKIKQINLLSANLGSYSKLGELLQFCYSNKVSLANNNFRIDDYVRMKDIMINTHQKNLDNEVMKFSALNLFKVVKVGLESPDQNCRMNANKLITDKTLSEFLDIALRYVSHIHFYLIFGLPKDNYDKWYEFIRNIKKRIRAIKDRKIRIEFSITNFEPHPYTPFESENEVNFTEKDKFLKEYINTLIEVGFIKDIGKNRDYSNMMGRIGRTYKTYSVFMSLLKGNESIGEMLYNSKISNPYRVMKRSIYNAFKEITMTMK
jgi:radical SAM superfamily enzyme YgiQ (UPF0313 family)